MLTLLPMPTRFVRRAICLLILSGCASAAPEFRSPPEGFSWSPEARFQREKKAEVPAEASGVSHFLIGHLLLGEGEFEQALKEFEAAAQANPDDAFLRFRLATLYLRKGDLKRALVEAAVAATIEPKNLDNHLLLAGLYLSLGETQKGLREYEEVLKLDPKNQEALLYLGALYLQLDDPSLATARLEDLLKLDPNSALGHYYLGRVRAKSKLYLGASYTELKSDDRALEEFGRIAEKSDLFIDARIQMAYIYDRREQIQKAIEALQAALRKKNDRKEIYALLASLYRKTKEYPKAIRAMERVTALDPKNDQAHFQLGALYDENKNKDKSIASMKKAIELNPQNAPALNYLGYTWAEMGVQLEEAESLIRRALQIEPNDGFYIDG